MQANTTKTKLKAGETVVGCFVRYPDASLVEMLAYQGWDFLVFDGEHGTLEPRDCENMVRAAELHSVTPMVRVMANLPPNILRLMDTGAQGVLVPRVNSSAEAEAAVSAVKYHPRGSRGLAAVRAAGYGQGTPLDEYVRRADEETLVVVQIESATALEQLEEIAAVDGVDAIFIGPSDLSQALGVPGQPQHPMVQTAMQGIVDTAARLGVPFGIFVGSEAAARQWRDRGARFIAIGLEALVTSAARSFLKAVRDG